MLLNILVYGMTLSLGCSYNNCIVKIDRGVTMHGWKGRIGLLLPHVNTTIEPEFHSMCPDGVSVHAARMVLKELTPEALIEMEQEIYKAASIVAAVNPDVIVVGCTSGSFIKGYGYDKTIIEKITAITKIPAITTSTAVVDALNSLKISKVAIATPFTEEINKKEREFIEAHGISVTGIKGLGYSQVVTSYPLASKPTSGIGLLFPAVAYRLALDVNSQDADGIFISCANFRTIEIIEPLEKNTGKPVISSVQATMAMALKVMGVKEKVTGYGRLLAGA